MKLSDAKKILSGEWEFDGFAGDEIRMAESDGCGDFNYHWAKLSICDIDFMLRQLALKTEREAKARK